MPANWNEPSAEQQEQCRLVQVEIVETVNRLAREGVDPPIIIAGIGAAIADTLTSIYGPEAVSKWFASQAALAMHMAEPQRRQDMN